MNEPTTVTVDRDALAALLRAADRAAWDSRTASEVVIPLRAQVEMFWKILLAEPAAITLTDPETL